MTNHPNRGRTSGASTPTAESIKAARLAVGHTQTAAAGTIHGNLRTWQDWEGGARRMPPAAFDLYRLLTGQHPDFVVMPR